MANQDSRNLTQTSANGVKGFLIRGIDDHLWFRVYQPDHSFVHYEITHYDCEIEIVDTSAALIRCDAGDFLDYTQASMTIVK